MINKDCLSFLYGLQGSGIKLGLDNMRRLCAALGHPEEKLRFIHIAGTNGKGSVAAMLESVLRRAGYRTGLYTSPHLIEFGERIRVDGVAMSGEELAASVESLRPVVEKLRAEGFEPTFFEATTALAFRHFVERGVEIVVLETGLGGRLDSTNVVLPECAVVTGISIDHTEYLGNTLEEIAIEKAGIFKVDVPAVVAPMNQGEVFDVLHRRANEVGALWMPVPAPGGSATVLADGGFHQSFSWKGERWDVCLAGEHQARNAATALAVLEVLRQGGWNIPREAVDLGFAAVSWPGRFQLLRGHPAVVLDGGHNAGGLAATLKTWTDVFGKPPGRILFGCMADKDVDPLIALLENAGSEIWLVPVASPRSAVPARLAEKFRKTRPVTWESLEAAWRAAESEPADAGMLLVGSLYLVGEALALCEKRKHQLDLN